MNKWSRPFEGSRASALPAGSGLAPVAHHYFAFLSYSHEDAAIADWLHAELERFRVPSGLAGRLTANGVVPTRLSPIFRDRHELAAGRDLDAEIRQALAASRCLIVLCSPAAARSKWTNSEIEEFKRAHPEGCVIAAIVAGEPFASEKRGAEKDECFPAALRQKYDRRGRPTGRRAEPLAADLRDSADGKRLGLLKIVAGILGVGLDDLVQRDHLRRQRRLAAITAGSLGGMLVASLLAVAAITARDEARDQRRAAESLVGFMLGDLKDKLEPIGRLDVLDSVGARALAYYEKQDMSELSDDALVQRSRALTLLGQVANTRGDSDAAFDNYRAAFAGTQEALRRSPEDPERIFDHAQNVFYLGDLAYSRGDLRQAFVSMREYKRLAGLLVAADRTNPEWQMEGIYADSNLGVMLTEQGRFGEAAALFENALVEREQLAKDDPANPQYRKALIEGLGWLSTAREFEGRLAEALEVRQRQVQLLIPLTESASADVDYKRQAIAAFRAAGRIRGMRGEVPEGLEQLQTALLISEQLLTAEPTNSYSRALSAGARLELAQLFLGEGNLTAAAPLVRSGCDLAERLIATDPSVSEWRLELRPACLQLQARLALARGSIDEANQQARRLRDLLATEVVRSDSPKARLVLARAEVLGGLVAHAAGDRKGSAAAFRKAAAAIPKEASERPANLAMQALILKGLGRREQAASTVAKLERTGFRDKLFLRDMRALG